MGIVLTNDDAIIPTRASKGLDLYSSIDAIIEVGSINEINLYISSRKFLWIYKR